MRHFAIYIWKGFCAYEPCRSYWISDDETIYMWLQPDPFAITVALTDWQINK